MKHNIRTILVSAALSISALVMSSPSAYASEPETPIIAGAMENIDYEVKEITAYTNSDNDTETIPAIFRKDLPEIPLIRMTDYMHIAFGDTDTVSDKEGEGIYTVTDNTGSVTVDIINDTISSDTPDFFAFKDYSAKGFMYTERGAVEYKTKSAVNIDTGKYGLDLTAVGDEVYMPVCTLNDIFYYSYTAAYCTNGEIHFIDILTEDIDHSDYYNSLERSGEMAEYNYNELCFAMDTVYGCPPRSALADSIKKIGFDRTLDEYSEDTREAKRLIRSDNKLDYIMGLGVLDNIIYDGGHTFFYWTLDLFDEQYDDSLLLKEYSQLTTDDLRVALFLKTDSGIYNVWELGKRIAGTREEAYGSMKLVKRWDNNASSALYEYNDTGIFVFDRFCTEMMESFKWSLDYCKEKGLKNFVLDISYNNGGDSDCLDYIMYIMTGKKSGYYYKDAFSDDTFDLSYEFDVNMDGMIDENDSRKSYDFNYAIIESEYSFSCGNLLPCMAKEDGVALFGEVSGGGACTINPHMSADGLKYYISGNIGVDSSGKDIDGGAIPDYQLVKTNEDGTRDYSGLYDFAAIEKGIDEFYGNAGKGTNVYLHDPMKNPKACEDIIANPKAVYGYEPNPESVRLGAYADYDWTDKAVVYKMRKERRDYHESLKELHIMISDMRAEGRTTEEIARAVSIRRNEIRMESYKDDPVALEKLKASNLAKYGNENGGTPDYFYEKYGSWETVIEKSMSTNAGADACLGLYDECYDSYMLPEEEPEATVRPTATATTSPKATETATAAPTATADVLPTAPIGSTATPIPEAKAQSTEPPVPTATSVAPTAVPVSEQPQASATSAPAPNVTPNSTAVVQKAGVSSLMASKAKLKVSSKTLQKGRTYKIVVLKKNGQKVTFSVWDRKAKKKIKKNRISISSKGKIKVTAKAKEGIYIVKVKVIKNDKYKAKELRLLLKVV